MSSAEPASVTLRRYNWIKIALVGSLALNLLFVGGAGARFFMNGPPDRMSGISQVQLIPRKFFGELSRERRKELLLVFRDFGKQFREGRKAAREQSIGVAAALEAEPYDEAQLKAAIDAFTIRSDALVAAGGEAALTLISTLSPDERKLLARHIRQRDEGMRRKHGGNDEDGRSGGG